MTYIALEHGCPRVVESLWTVKIDRLAVVKRVWEHCKAFDAESRYDLIVTHVPRVTPLQQMLAYTLYNPSVDITATWTRVGDRLTSDLLDAVRAALKKDDDIITQWFDSNQVMTLLESASSWDDLVLAVRCICGEHETNGKASAYVKRVLKANRI
jgi:hypothetical protein